MSLEKNKAMIRKGVEEVNKRNLAVLDEFIAPDYVDHTNPLRGLEDVKQFYTKAFKDFPDYHRTIEDIIAEGEKVWLLAEVTATHKGEWLSFLPYINKNVRLVPTDKKTKFTYVGLYHIVDGKIAERRSIHALVEFYKDIGVIEYTEKAKQLFPE